jgi:NAD(P)H-dependent FMN reductase
MKKILIVSATSGNNLDLAQNLETVLKTFEIETRLLNLETLNLPLFTPSTPCDSALLTPVAATFQNYDGFVFCAPEYNGGVPPVLSNTIAWITVSTDSWRGAFAGKCALLASHSYSSAYRFFTAFRNQLEYLGVLVMPRVIIRQKGDSLKMESVERIVSDFLRHVQT